MSDRADPWAAYLAELRQASIDRDVELIERSRARLERCEPLPPHDPATCQDCIPELELRALHGDR